MPEAVCLVPGFHASRINGGEIGSQMDAVVDHAELVLAHPELLLHLLTQYTGNRDDAVGGDNNLLLDASYPLRLAAVVDVAAAAILGAVDRCNRVAAHILALDQGLCGKPVVAVADVKLGPLKSLRLRQKPAERVAIYMYVCIYIIYTL